MDEIDSQCGEQSAQDCHEIAFDLNIYSLSAIKKAAHKFSGQFHIRIEKKQESAFVTLRSKSQTQSGRAVAGELENEVLDQELRESIAEQTNPLRQLIIAQAFSRTSLVSPELDTDDYKANLDK